MNYRNYLLVNFGLLSVFCIVPRSPFLFIFALHLRKTIIHPAIYYFNQNSGLVTRAQTDLRFLSLISDFFITSLFLADGPGGLMKGDEAGGLGEGSASKIKILSIKVILGLVQITLKMLAGM